MRKRHFRLSPFILTALILLSTPHPLSASAQESLDGVVFLGDSTTNAYASYGLIPESRVLTGPMNTLSMWDVSKKKIKLTKKMLDSYKELEGYESFLAKLTDDNGNKSVPLMDIMTFLRPKMLVITLGINGCSSMSDNAIKAEYRALLEGVRESSPATEIYLVSILPVASRASKVRRERITVANGVIRALAEELGLMYIDVHSHLTSLYGEEMPYEILDSADGIHYSHKGCQVILKYIEGNLK